MNKPLIVLLKDFLSHPLFDRIYICTEDSLLWGANYILHIDQQNQLQKCEKKMCSR